MHLFAVLEFSASDTPVTLVLLNTLWKIH